MAIQQQARSSVARRIHVSFIAAAALPLILLASLAYYMVSEELEDSALQSARAMAKELGMALFDRLKFISDELTILGKGVGAQPGRLPGLAGLDLANRARGLLRVDPGGQLSADVPLAAAEQAALMARLAASDASLPLMLTLGEATAKRIFLFVHIGENNESLLGAELAPAYTWDTSGIAARPERVCVMDPDTTPVYCNHELNVRWLRNADTLLVARGRSRPRALDAGAGGALLTAVWSLYLKPHYQFERWTILVGVPKSLALASVSVFDRVFAGVALIALMLAFMLGRRLIRSNLKPLASLSQATEMLAEGRFEHRISLSSGDEFQQLGDAFDGMAARVGQQFNELETLAELDRTLQGARTLDAAIVASGNACDRLLGEGRCAILCQEHWRDQGQLHVLGFAGDRLITPSLVSRPRLAGREHETTVEQLLKEHAHLGEILDGNAPTTRVRQFPVLGCDDLSAELILLEPQPDDAKAVSRVGDVLAITLENLVMERRLFHQAHHDWLSGLPNRSHLRDLFDLQADRTASSGGGIGMLLIDLDRFKQVNDSMGHTAGDDLLKEVAERLREVLPKDWVLSRLAGDEFLVMIVHEDASALTNVLTEATVRVQRELDRPFSLGPRDVRLSATAGAAIHPGDGDTFKVLLQSLDAAAYEAKRQRRGGLMFFSASMRESLAGRMDMEQALKLAVANDELELHFQPVVDSRTERVRSAECLMRWRRPGIGLVRPDQFIAVAEDSGLIQGMGRWALCRACEQLLEWREAGYLIETLAVNVSGVQLADDDFERHLAEALGRSGLDPRALTLEVTETALIGQFEVAVERLKRIRAMGVRVMIDDFGTGYASFKYLKMLPVDGLKIDQLFVRDLPGSATDEAIIAAVVSLAEASEFKLVAEGVETDLQAAYLRDAGVPNLQGYLFAPGLSAEQFARRLHDDYLIAASVASGG